MTPSTLADRMKAIVGSAGVLTAPSDLATYECDGFTIAKVKPDVVVFPMTTAHVVATQASQPSAIPSPSPSAVPQPSGSIV